MTGVHPHGRGEKSTYHLRAVEVEGSPPRAWGKVAMNTIRLALQRFTPTGVGKRCGPRPRRGGPRVHPHGRGEKQVLARIVLARDGSPPRAWGKDRPRGDGRGAGRFTPTGVGKRRSSMQSSTQLMVHPHGRGEKLRDLVRALWSWRFTPTGVGKRRRQRETSPRPAVHPHGRGEKGYARRMETPCDGSPPRAWGKGCPYTARPTEPWFTPTGVGKRTRWRRPRR